MVYALQISSVLPYPLLVTKKSSSPVHHLCCIISPSQPLCKLRHRHEMRLEDVMDIRWPSFLLALYLHDKQWIVQMDTEFLVLKCELSHQRDNISEFSITVIKYLRWVTYRVKCYFPHVLEVQPIINCFAPVMRQYTMPKEDCRVSYSPQKLENKNNRKKVSGTQNPP